MRKALVTAVSALALVLGPAVSASAFEPVEIVHTEQVQAGPYEITVGFSVWPVRAQQALDFTFVPDDGIDGKSGTVEVIGADVSKLEPLARHPRKQDVWGLDVASIPTEGDWAMKFMVDGPKGQGVGELSTLPVLEQPGPPLALSWLISTLPLWGLVALVTVAWRRTSSTASRQHVGTNPVGTNPVGTNPVGTGTNTKERN